MEDNKKGIKLKLEFKENSKITFLDVEITRGEKNNEKISTRWFRKKDDAGIMCNWRSDVDNSTKTNITKNLERKIEKLTTEEKIKRN